MDIACHRNKGETDRNVKRSGKLLNSAVVDVKATVVRFYELCHKIAVFAEINAVVLCLEKCLFKEIFHAHPCVAECKLVGDIFFKFGCELAVEKSFECKLRHLGKVSVFHFGKLALRHNNKQKEENCDEADKGEGCYFAVFIHNSPLRNGSKGMGCSLRRQGMLSK